MTEEPQQEAAHAPKGFWGSLRNHILHPELTAEQVALSFGLGFSLAWNPLLGLHTAIILLVCLCTRRLHRGILLLACYINNPWTMVPMASFSALAGNVILGRGMHLKLKGIHWHEITWRSFATREGLDVMFVMLKPILIPYLVGGIVMSLVTLPLGYFVMLKVARRLRKAHFRLPHHLPPQSPR